jgi:hypothetical protein
MPSAEANLTSAALLRRKTYAFFDGGKRSGSLAELCLKLLSEQKKTWPDLRQAYASLKQVRTRRVRCRGFSVLLQHNPGRATSSLARVDEKNINQRPCFLCLENLPSGQKGILYRDEYLILCNPAPVFSSHLTISCVEHRPQAIVSNIDSYLQLMADLGPGWTSLYNGPRCGASAPDHLHFQAVPAGRMPVEQQIEEANRLIPVSELDSLHVYLVKDLGREALLLQGDDPSALARALSKCIDSLKAFLRTDAEPMLNVAGFYREGTWRLLVFPRRKHRPDVFFEEGDARIVVSPAVMEMAGILVTPVERDFEGLDKATVESIYEEVSLEAKTLEQAIDAMRNLIA